MGSPLQAILREPEGFYAESLAPSTYFLSKVAMYCAQEGTTSSDRLSAVVHKFGRRECLPRMQDLLWQIDFGFVRTFTLDEDGTIMTLGIWGAGDVVGYPLAKVDPYHIECLNKVQARRFQADASTAFEQVLWSHLSQSQAFLVIRQGSMRVRLDRFLVWLADKFGQRSDTGYHIPFRLTHQDIADVIDSTRVTVTRSVGELEEKGYLRWSRKSFWVSHDIISTIKIG